MPKFARRTSCRDHVDAGAQLVRASALVGDSDDFVIWLQRAMEWRSGLDDHLAGRHGVDAVQKARDAADSIRAQGSWQERLAAEIARVDALNEFIESLAGTAGAGPERHIAEPVGARGDNA